MPINFGFLNTKKLCFSFSISDENDEELWRHAFLIERGKMTTSRYQKIQQRDEHSR
jgi:hypothetical protein